MRTVLLGVAGRASLILVAAGMVGSAAFSASPAAAQSQGSSAQHRHGHGRGGDAGPVKTEIGDAVKYVKAPDGSVRRVR